MTTKNVLSFEEIPSVKPDPIFALNAEFEADSRDKKVNLGVGIYKGEDLKQRLMRAVDAAQKQLADKSDPKPYLPITGSPPFIKAIESLIYGEKAPFLEKGEVASAQAPGGTGALRVGAESLRGLGHRKIYLSDPTWANHRPIFEKAGLETAPYPYYDPETQSISFSKMQAFMEELPEGSLVLLHACCHNPTGCDLSQDQWRTLSEIFLQKGVIPFFDFAYQGFAEGIEEDAFPIRLFSDKKHPVVTAYSLSKNFGLYNERTGLISFRLKTKEEGEKMRAFIKTIIRPNYSNPPSHGALLAQVILEDPKLRKEWEKELASMRERVKEMRRSLSANLQTHQSDRDFSFLTKQKGMFSLFNFDQDQIHQLKKENGIYMPKGGRINFAGLTQSTVEVVGKALTSF